MISMTFTGPPSEKVVVFYNHDRAKADASIQNISGLSQGPVHPFGGRLSVRGTRALRLKENHHERAGCRGETGVVF